MLLHATLLTLSGLISSLVWRQVFQARHFPECLYRLSPFV